MTRELYARSTRYGSNDEYVLEVSASRIGTIYIVLDEDDPECDAEFMTLRTDQADAVATMLKGAVEAVRKERVKRKQAEEEHRLETEAEDRRQLENEEMARHFEKHPHG